jgi:hypothetical protein
MEGPSGEVEVVGGEPTSLRLDFRSEWVVDRLCAGDSPRAEGQVAGPAALLGRVREAETGDPLPEATISLRAPDGGAFRSIRADGTGAFLVCGLGPPGSLSLQAAAAGRRSEPVWVVVPESGVVIQDLEVPAAPTGDPG